jgi:hypothetical protein
MSPIPEHVKRAPDFLSEPEPNFAPPLIIDRGPSAWPEYRWAGFKPQMRLKRFIIWPHLPFDPRPVKVEPESS